MINKINRDSESLSIHDVRVGYDERVARHRSPSSFSFRGGVVAVEDLYIYTYIYMYMWIYIYIFLNTNGGTVHEKTGKSRQRRKPAHPHGGAPGERGRRRGPGGTALHPTHPPRWPVAENDETGEKKWWAKK